MYRRTALKASLLAFCKNDKSLAAVRSYRWSSSDDPLAVGRGRVPLLYISRLAEILDYKINWPSGGK